MTNCDHSQSDCDCHSNSGFIFGLICGAIIGAIIAVIIYKNNKTEVFAKLEQKIKSFFEDIFSKTQNSPPNSKFKPKKVAIKASSNINPSIKPEPKEIVPIFVKPKKTAPKMFVKPKK